MTTQLQPVSISVTLETSEAERKADTLDSKIVGQQKKQAEGAKKVGGAQAGIAAGATIQSTFQAAADAARGVSSTAISSASGGIEGAAGNVSGLLGAAGYRSAGATVAAGVALEKFFKNVNPGLVAGAEGEVSQTGYGEMADSISKFLTHWENKAIGGFKAAMKTGEIASNAKKLGLGLPRRLGDFTAVYQDLHTQDEDYKADLERNYSNRVMRSIGESIRESISTGRQ